MSVTQSECVFLALGIQHAMRMHHMINCGPPRSTTFFHTVSYKAGFSKKKLINTKCVFGVPLQILSETFFIISRSERDMTKMCIGLLLHVKNPLFLSDFNET